MLKRLSPVSCRSREDERGAAIVEFALVATFLFTVIFGMIEGGLMVRARNAVHSATDDATRRGAIAADDPLADWMILQQLRGRGLLSAATVNFVVVYRSDEGSAPPTAACQAGTAVADECNVYTRADFDVAPGSFGCLSAALDANWCPTTRVAGAGDFDYLGVWVDARHDSITGFLGDIDIKASTSLPIEGGGV